MLTLGYGERGRGAAGIAGTDSSSTSALGTELTSGVGSGAGSTFGGALLASGIGSGFSRVGVGVGGGAVASAGAGRALLETTGGRRAFPIC